MANLLKSLHEKHLIHCPDWLPDNTMYLAINGSIAYGVSDDESDFDLIGWTMPPKKDVFPHLDGEIVGFGSPRKRFEQFDEKRIFDPQACSGKGRLYDFNIYSIVKYFDLALNSNPNIISSLFTPADCLLHCSAIGELVRNEKSLFLCKECWPKFKGYAYSQLHKMSTKEPEPGSSRYELRQKFGYDCHFAYHIVRLIYEVEQILMYADCDLRKHSDHLKAIKRGEIKESDVRNWFADKEKALEQLYATSALPDRPQKARIFALLVKCLEHHYGDLSTCVVEPDASLHALKEISYVLDRYKKLL